MNIELQQLEAERAECKTKIDKAAKLEKLLNNPDFKEIFLEDYLNNESLRLVDLLGQVAPGNIRDGVVNEMIGLSNFRCYINAISKSAQQAEEKIAEQDAAIFDIENSDGEE